MKQQQTIKPIKNALFAIASQHGTLKYYRESLNAIDKIYAVKPDIDKRKMYNWVYKETKNNNYKTSVDGYKDIYRRIIANKPMPWTDARSAL